MQITKSEFKNCLLAAVEGYIADEETYDDNAQLQIDPETGKATIVDSEDIAGMDYYDVMDLVKMDPDSPGSWKPDIEAVDSVVDEYFK